EDAYPGGTPGKGGNGGTIASTLHPLFLISPFCDVNPGEPGSPTKAVFGKDCGTPNPAYRATMTILKKTAFAVKADPSLTVENVTGKKGTDAPGRTNVPGESGAITGLGPGEATSPWTFPVQGDVSGVTRIKLPPGNAKSWADPLALDAVLA